MYEKLKETLKIVEKLERQFMTEDEKIIADLKEIKRLINEIIKGE